MNRGGGDPEKERFYLTVSIHAKKRLLDYCVDLEFPSAFLISRYAGQVKERRTDSHVVLRATPENFAKVLNPGNNDLMGVEFFVNRDGSQEELMSEMVRATAYCGDVEVTVQRSLAVLCNKGLPLVFRDNQ